MVFNNYMLGVVFAFLPVKEESWIKAMDDIFKREQTQNKAYFFQGRQEGAKK